MLNYRKYLGFTLIELSIVLVVVSIAIGSGLMVFNRYSDESKVKQTESKMKEIMNVIKRYSMINGGLPCPANPQLKFSDDNYGIAVNYDTLVYGCAGNGGSNIIRTEVSGKYVSMGMLPVSSLGLYPTYALDSWGNRFTYVVMDEDANGALVQPDKYFTSLIPLKNYAGTSYAGIIVLLISHGENGYGAYSGAGGTVKINNSLGTSNEQANYASSSSITSFYASPRYNGFDDILTFWNYYQIINTTMMLK